MKTDITTDLKRATFEARRVFNADVSLVWRAWTEPELLDQWWAPAPWKCKTKFMNFSEGGKWVYDMIGPNGEVHGGVQIYEKIAPKDYFSGSDAFADESGEINENLPVSTWKCTFEETEEGTLVTSFAQYSSPEALETVIKMGMAEGLTMAHNQLEEVLNKVKAQ